MKKKRNHHAGHKRPRRAEHGRCRICGCTANDACYHEALGSCWWFHPDLCSHCHAIAAGEIDRCDVEQPADRAAMRLPNT